MRSEWVGRSAGWGCIINAYLNGGAKINHVGWVFGFNANKPYTRSTSRLPARQNVSGDKYLSVTQSPR